MLEIFAVTLPYFALIACGYLARGTGVMGEGSPRVLNDFVLFFALPALMIRTIGNIPLEEVLRPGFIAVWAIVSVALFAGSWLVSGGLFRQGGRVATIHAAAAAHGNVGYLGISLVISLMGEGAAAPVAMAIIFDM
ncbi:MAG: AEC family transporter, partial [Pseudomonadota bacterium]